ncbi:MAG: MerR family transcriptional regulator [Intrasporangium sp.]|uniref:MerR family transcriptional regulator n=1 Tax=Intrasporangium sp. TaxID=1925024 RepID=UPI002647A4CC|nr:MerR family transcriptional regulator [Intrasporangium sp.]MDN5798393.1 MerR family transcriptional regulator [Intrasporangium sp.]
MSDEEPAPHRGPRRRNSVPELAWPVGAVAERLGVSASTLRSWDRRHGIGPTSRTDGRHRRYSESDIRRVMLMARLTAHGIPAQAAAAALDEMDDEAVAERLQGGAPAPGPMRNDAEPASPTSLMSGAGRSMRTHPSQVPADGAPPQARMVESIVSAATALDGQGLSAIYRQSLRQHAVGDAWSDIFVPALSRIGELWADGEVGIEVEHLASEMLQTELRGVSRANRLRLVGPPVVLANADNEMHHLPLLALEAGLAGHSVATLFLGPRLPTESLVDALVQTKPRVLFLWASLARRHWEPLWDGLQTVDWPLTVVIGGPGWPEHVAHHNPYVTLDRVADFSSALRVLVAANGADTDGVGIVQGDRQGPDAT